MRRNRSSKIGRGAPVFRNPTSDFRLPTPVPGGAPIRLTKIHATLGPASRDLSVILKMIDAGMDAVRINMSHCSPEMGHEIVAAVRAAATKRDTRIPVGADLRGPKLRIGEVEGGRITLESGGRVTLTCEPRLSDASTISVEYPYLAESLRPGSSVLLHDGFISLTVEDVHDRIVVCRVIKGGRLLSRKGVNLPGAPLRVPSVTEKDLEDIDFAVRAGVDFLYVSYARSRRHIQEVRSAVAAHGVRLPILAKIERQDGVDALSEIVDEAEGICIARGDLGVEVPLGQTPGIQRDAARLCLQADRFAMMGGQVLSSMATNPLPLRAEISDLATVVRDQMDAIVLSDETASGDYPVEAVATAAAVLEAAEQYERLRGAVRSRLGLVAPR